MADLKQQMETALGKLNEQTKELNGIGELSVQVGLPSDRIHNPSGLPLSEIGAIHEFGLNEIPERSFLRGSIIAKNEEIKKQLDIIANKASLGESAEVLMEQFALWGQGMVQEYISNGEQNFESLKKPRKDGSENPLNDTGELKQGVIGVVVDG